MGKAKRRYCQRSGKLRVRWAAVRPIFAEQHELTVLTLSFSGAICTRGVGQRRTPKVAQRHTSDCRRARGAHGVVAVLAEGQYHEVVVRAV